MIIPIGTDNPLRKNPSVNYALVVVNFALFILVNLDAERAQSLLLQPERLRLHQFITYAFFHANWMHIVGNMLFLYIFGNNVNDKLGNFGYLLLYLSAAVFSGIGHVLTSNTPVLGASGAVAAVTGAYMVLFPRTYVHILYVIIFIGTMEVPAFYFILFKLIIWDNVFEPKLYGGGNVAYTAHIAGYIFGIGIPLLMLALKLLPHSQFDLWALIRRWRQRQQYRSMSGKGYDAYSYNQGSRKKVKAKVTTPSKDESLLEEIMQLRSRVSEAFARSEMEDAARQYLRLAKLDPDQVLPQQQQLDIANKLMQTSRYSDAAGAYEVFLQHYEKYPFIEQVRLMLGLLYSRYLNEKDKAREQLGQALEKLTDPGQRKMCEDELSRL